MKRKAKVSIFTEAIVEGGGPMGYVFNMMRGFQDINDIDISFIRYNKPERIKKIKNKFFNKIDIFFWYKFNKLRIIKACKSSDLCFFQGYQNSKYVKLAKRFNKKCMYMPHSPYIAAEEMKRVFEMNGSVYPQKDYDVAFKNEDDLFNLSDYVVFATRNAANPYFDTWGKVLENKKVFYIESGVIVRKSSDSIHLLDNFKDKIKIGFIGRYVNHKGYDLFCDCAEKFSERKDVAFFTAGSGPLKEYGINKNIYDLGFVQGVGNLIKDLDIVIIANTIAYYDLLPLECASYGKPLIMSYVGGNIDQLCDFEDSLQFEAGNVDSLYSAVLEGIDVVKNNGNWGERNKKVYLEKFTETAMCDRWNALLKEVVKK